MFWNKKGISEEKWSIRFRVLLKSILQARRYFKNLWMLKNVCMYSNFVMILEFSKGNSDIIKNYIDKMHLIEESVCILRGCAFRFPLY